MTAFHIDKGPRKQRMKVFILVALTLPLMLTVGAAGATYVWYQQSITPVSSANTEVVITIQEGATAREIGELLESRGVIRSAVAFDWYTRLNDQRNNLQAGGYKFMPSMSVQEITTVLTNGDVAEDLVTILPAQRLDQIEMVFLDAGYTQAQINEALDPASYPGHPALVDLPAGASLEGYLYPESYQRQIDTPLTAVVELSLDLTAETLTSNRLEIYENYGLNSYQAITLASIVEREVSNPDERAQVAQVFLKRYQEGISLGSDPTALYGALIAGIEPSVFADTPYNTRIYAGLPPGPINNISEDSMDALANPSDTNYLFFVSGDDGITRFSNTLAEHEAKTAQYCIELCQSY